MYVDQTQHKRGECESAKTEGGGIGELTEPGCVARGVVSIGLSFGVFFANGRGHFLLFGLDVVHERIRTGDSL
jgi:hypothetical protein